MFVHIYIVFNSNKPVFKSQKQFSYHEYSFQNANQVQNATVFKSHMQKLLVDGPPQFIITVVDRFKGFDTRQNFVATRF